MWSSVGCRCPRRGFGLELFQFGQSSGQYSINLSINTAMNALARFGFRYRSAVLFTHPPDRS
jgi:hypothetical protein